MINPLLEHLFSAMPTIGMEGYCYSRASELPVHLESYNEVDFAFVPVNLIPSTCFRALTSREQ